MTRRSTFLALLASPLAFVKGLWAKPLPPLPSGSDIISDPVPGTLYQAVLTERARCIRIVENSVSAQPDRMSMPSSYDATELADGTFESVRSQNLELRKRWAIQRLTAKSVVALIRGEDGPSNLDEHDDLALMELGYVPGIGKAL